MSKNNGILLLKKIQSNLSDEETLKWCKRQPSLQFNYMDKVGHTPLTMAGAQGKQETVVWLISNGSRLCHKQMNGFNVFSAALHNGHFDLAQTLFYEYRFEIDSLVHSIVDKFNVDVFIDILHFDLFGDTSI